MNSEPICGLDVVLYHQVGVKIDIIHKPDFSRVVERDKGLRVGRHKGCYTVIDDITGGTKTFAKIWELMAHLGDERGYRARSEKDFGRWVIALQKREAELYDELEAVAMKAAEPKYLLTSVKGNEQIIVNCPEDFCSRSGVDLKHLLDAVDPDKRRKYVTVAGKKYTAEKQD